MGDIYLENLQVSIQENKEKLTLKELTFSSYAMYRLKR